MPRPPKQQPFLSPLCPFAHLSTSLPGHLATQHLVVHWLTHSPAHIHPPSPHLSTKPSPHPPIVPSVQSVIKIHLGPVWAGLELGVRSRDEHNTIPSLENLLVLEATDLQTEVASCDKTWLEMGKGCSPSMQTRELQLLGPREDVQRR